MRSVPRVYNKVPEYVVILEAGLNTSTVTLRVVGGVENESLKSETVKYGREYQEIRTRARLRLTEFKAILTA
jgi:hypothetical protein